MLAMAGRTPNPQRSHKHRTQSHLLKLERHRHDRQAMEHCLVHAVQAAVRHECPRGWVAQHILQFVGA
jgi:hypothetical protein